MARRHGRGGCSVYFFQGQLFMLNTRRITCRYGCRILKYLFDLVMLPLAPGTPQHCDVKYNEERRMGDREAGRSDQRHHERSF